MLKKIAKRIDTELRQANDYMQQAFMVKEKNRSLGDLFAQLSEEELVHAEKLLREGKRYIDNNTISDKEMTDSEWHKKCEIIWEWGNKNCHDYYL